MKSTTEIHKKLIELDKKIVLVESCTGGNVAAKLVVDCPGISKYLYGSHVVYDIDAKSKWLNIPKDYLEQVGTESQECANILATQAANINNMDAFSIVGHLNEQAIVYLAYAFDEVEEN